MMSWQIGVVKEILHVSKDTQELLVEKHSGSPNTSKALQYMGDPFRAKPGDTVLLNTTATDLGLGTGGLDFVITVLPRQSPADDGRSMQTAKGHLMKLRYTPLQRKVLAAEEQASPYHEWFRNDQLKLGQTPVMIGELHSMLPVIISWLRYREQQYSMRNKLRIVYVMSEGGALPAAFSKHIRLLKQLKWLQGVVTYGHAYGGDVETINKFTALLAAKHIFQADVICVIMGPGIAGTETPLGHSGMETGEVVNAVHALGGKAVYVPRISFTDSRMRHRGISHHSLQALKVAALSPAWVPLPANLGDIRTSHMKQQWEMHQLNERHQLVWHPIPSGSSVQQALACYPERLQTMGHDWTRHRHYFLSVAAAADWAWETFLCFAQSQS